MVKSRKKKNEKKDFQKVKFKVGKKLPKADNVTNVSFKSKGIHIKEQLKTEAAQPSNKRKQNINDLLSQTRHYNTTIRHDSLMGLKELILMHPEVGRENLAEIIERVSALFVDKDGVIRQTVLKLFNVLFPMISANALAPFFPVINAHLCCAMTHIDEHIQADSLAVVDVLLKFYPDVLIKHCSQLLPNFINLISKQTQKNTKSGPTATRTLSVNPNTNVHAQKWRMEVLERLYNFLSALAKNVEERQDGKSCAGASPIVSCVDRTVFYQPKIPRSNPVPFFGGFELRPQQGMKNLPHQDILKQPQQLKDFVLTLMPLLLECWVECSPAQLVADIPGNAPPAEALAVMLSIIKVIQLLWHCVEGLTSDNEEISHSWLADSYMNECIHHFMAYFPFSGLERLERNKKSKKVEVKQVSTMGLNLRVCDIMVYFLQEKLTEVSHSHWVHNLVDFIIAAAGGSRLAAEDSQLLMEIFRRVLKVEFPDGSILLNDLLEAVWSMYRRSQPDSLERRHLLTLMLEDILPKKHYLSYPMMQEWLASLPEFLLKCKLDNVDTVDLILKAMATVGAQKHQSFSSSFEKYLDGILDPENGVLLQLNCRQQRKLIEMLYSVSTMDKGDFINLLGCCRSDTFGIDNLRYLLQILHHRYQHHGNHFCEPSAYLSFMLSLCTGCQDIGGSTAEDRLYMYSVDGLESHAWDKQLKIMQIICELLSLLPNSGQVWTVAFSFIMKIKKRKHMLSLTNAVGILQLHKYLYKSGVAVEKQVRNEFSEIVVLVAMTMLVLKEEGSLSQMDIDGTESALSQTLGDVMKCGDGRLLSAQVTDVWVLLKDVLVGMPGLVDSCLEMMSKFLSVSECSTGPDRRHVLSALVNLLKPDTVKLSVMNKGHLREMVEKILTALSGSGQHEYSKEVAALKYEVSLI